MAADKVDDILEAFIAQHHTAIEQRGALIAANKALKATRTFLRWCVGRAVLDQSPADGVPLPAKEAPTDRVLADEELARVIIAGRKMGHPYGGIVELLELTGQRREELRERHGTNSTSTTEFGSCRMPAPRMPSLVSCTYRTNRSRSTRIGFLTTADPRHTARSPQARFLAVYGPNFARCSASFEITNGCRPEDASSTAPIALFATSSLPPGGWSIESLPPRAVRRSSPHSCAASLGRSKSSHRLLLITGKTSR